MNSKYEPVKSLKQIRTEVDARQAKQDAAIARNHEKFLLEVSLLDITPAPAPKKRTRL